MTPVLLAVAAALAMQGNLPVAIEVNTRTTTEGRVLDIFCELPRGALVQVRENGEFVARYQLRVQALAESRNRLLAARVWNSEARRAALSAESTIAGRFEFVLPDSAAVAVIEVRDLASERRASGRTVLRVSGQPEVTTGSIPRRFTLEVVGAEGAAVRRFGIDDTVRAVARSATAAQPDSFLFRLSKQERPVVEHRAVAAELDSGRQAFFLYPVAGEPGRSRLRNGDYELTVYGISAGRADQRPGAQATLSVSYPFFLDDSVYRERVERLLHIATSEEIRKLLAAPPVERESLWRNFWSNRDRTAGVTGELDEAEYFARIEYADEKFRHGDLGFRSDRAKVYVIYGAPDQIETRPFELDSPAVEIWYYYAIGRSFVFVDRYGTGQFVLSRSRG